MKVTNWFQKSTKNASLCAGSAILAGGMMFSGTVDADVDYLEDFENVTLNTGAGDPAVSYSNSVPGWVVDNSLMVGTSVAEYQGGNVLDIAEWVAEAGQGRNTGDGDDTTDGPLGGNRALVFDPDQWDDTNDDTTGSTTGFNSFWSYNFNFAGEDLSTIAIGFSYEFRSYPTQVMRAEVSFDGGNSYSTLLQLDVSSVAETTYASGNASYASGTDFTPTSDSMELRFSMTDGGNDWWGAVDNVSVNSVSAIPEPGSAGLIGLGLLGLGVIRRRKN